MLGLDEPKGEMVTEGKEKRMMMTGGGRETEEKGANTGPPDQAGGTEHSRGLVLGFVTALARLSQTGLCLAGTVSYELLVTGTQGRSASPTWTAWLGADSALQNMLLHL